MKYTIIPLRDDKGVYRPLGVNTEQHALLPDAKEAVGRWYYATGIIPDVIVDGKKVQLFTNEEVGNWATKRTPRPLDLGEDLA